MVEISGYVMIGKVKGLSFSPFLFCQQTSLGTVLLSQVLHVHYQAARNARLTRFPRIQSVVRL